MRTMSTRNPTDLSTVRIPAGQGKGVRLRAGEALRVINTHGAQVVDCWAFNAADIGEYLSMPHSRNLWLRVSPRAGDALVSNRRRAMLTLVEDSSPGVHDTQIPCCDATRYEELGLAGHANCADNMAAALAELGVSPAPEPPAPLNLFMNVPIAEDGSLRIAAPVSTSGDHVLLRAEMDCLVALSACPHDIYPVNGEDCTPKDIEFRVEA